MSVGNQEDPGVNPTDRMPPISDADMTTEQRQAVAGYAATRNTSVFEGPFVPLLRSPELLDRVQRVGYAGRLVGENISETYETELETLAAWMEEPATRNVILDASARDMGFAWYQENNGKIWWTLVTGAPGMSSTPGGVEVASNDF